MSHGLIDAEKYWELKKNMDDAYTAYNRNPTFQTNEVYKMALTEFQDFCVSVVALMVGDNDFVVNQ